jgi:hypothetical protein
MRNSDWFDPPSASALAPTQEIVRGWGRTPPGGLAGATVAGAAGVAGITLVLLLAPAPMMALVLRSGFISTVVPIVGLRGRP